MKLTVADLIRRAGLSAKLPTGYQWGRDAREQFDFGKQRAVEAILDALAQPASPGAWIDRNPPPVITESTLAAPKERIEAKPRRISPGPPAGYVSYAQRAGWNGYFDGWARVPTQYPPGRDDLVDGYKEGWDDARNAHPHWHVEGEPSHD